MDMAGIKSFLFRHVEKIALAVVVLWVSYQVYSSLFRAELVQPPPAGPGGAGGAKPGTATEDWFRRAAGPFVVIPPIEEARYNWFYPPATRWLRRVELEEEKKPVERRSARGRVLGTPLITPLAEEDRKDLGILAPPETLTEPCEVAVEVERGAAGSPLGDTLVFKGKKPGYWVRAMFTLENQDRVCVAVMMSRLGETQTTELARATILDVKEEPLSTVQIRFTAPEGSIKSKDGKSVVTFIEPTYYEILRKGEQDTEEISVGRVDGRAAKAAEPGTPGAPTPAPKAAPAGFPGAKAAPPKKEVAPPTKGGPPQEPGVLVFSDHDVEAETTYTYRVRSVLVSKEEGDQTRSVDGDAKTYRTKERFSFAYTGGDALRANIIVLIGPKDKPLGGKLFERIPIGGWIGDVPKELRNAAAPTGTAEAPAAEDAPAPPRERDDSPASRYITRYRLVDIEQGVLRLVDYTIRVPGKDAFGRPQFKEITAYRETYDRRVIICDTKKNRLHYLWLDTKAAVPAAAGPGR